jgi:hypothetical protein
MFLYTFISITEFSNGNNVLYARSTDLSFLSSRDNHFTISNHDLEEIVSRHNWVCEHRENDLYGIVRVWRAKK